MEGLKFPNDSYSQNLRNAPTKQKVPLEIRNSDKPLKVIE